MSNTKELLRYLVCGISTTLVNWIVYTLCVSGLNMNITLANALAWFFAVLFAFVISKYYVFIHSAHRNWMEELALFFSGRLFTGVIEIFLPAILMGIGISQALFGIPGFYAKVITTLIITILNYLVSKKIVFKEKASRI